MMRWRGRTLEQWKQDTIKWNRDFAALPTQMDSGEWLWLEHYEIRRSPRPNNRWNWIRRPIGSTKFEPRSYPDRPPPPSPTTQHTK